MAAWHRKGADPTLWLDGLTFDLYALENVGRLVTPAKKLEDNIRLAELVIEVLQQNEEHHAEVSSPTSTCVSPGWSNGDPRAGDAAPGF